jgi:hypothetical protein
MVVLSGPVAGISFVSVADAASFTVEEVREGKYGANMEADSAADDLVYSRGQPIKVQVRWSNLPDNTDRLELIDFDPTAIGVPADKESFDSEIDPSSSGQATFEIKPDDLESYIFDDQNEGNNKIELKMRVVRDGRFNNFNNIRKNIKSIGYVEQSIFLRDVPSSATQGESKQVTIYGWTGTEKNIPNWKLKEFDTPTSKTIVSGQSLKQNDNSFETKISFTPSNYDGGLNDPPINIRAIPAEGKKPPILGRSSEYKIDITEAPAEFKIQSTSSNEPIEGNEFTVTAKIKNTGDQEGSPTIQFSPSFDAGPYSESSQ